MYTFTVIVIIGVKIGFKVRKQGWLLGKGDLARKAEAHRIEGKPESCLGLEPCGLRSLLRKSGLLRERLPLCIPSLIPKSPAPDSVLRITATGHGSLARYHSLHLQEVSVKRNLSGLFGSCAEA